MNPVYLMKYALTSGAIAFNLTDDEFSKLNEEGAVFVKVNKSMYSSLYYRKDIALNRKEAEKMFEVMRVKKMESLGKQVKKYSQLQLKIV